MLFRVVDKKVRREVAQIELDGKEDQYNFRMIFPADQFIIVPVNFQFCEHERGIAA